MIAGILRKLSQSRLINAKNVALMGGIYTLNISIFVVVMLCGRILANVENYRDFGDVYYGIQISQIAVIAMQCSMAILSVVLIVGIHTENSALVVPWIVGFLTFISLETVTMVYSNVLRDHILKQFDGISKTFLAFFITRAVVNALAMWSVIRYHHELNTSAKSSTSSRRKKHCKIDEL